MTEERAIYEAQVEESLKEELERTRWLVNKLSEENAELKSDNLELEYKLATMYEMLHGRKPKNDVRDSWPD